MATSAVKLCFALSVLLMSRTHIKTEILVGPEPALGRLTRVGVSELWANSIDAARSATTSRNLLRCRLSGVRLFVSVMFTKALFASLHVGLDLLFAGEKLLESRVIADRIPHRINLQLSTPWLALPRALAPFSIHPIQSASVYERPTNSRVARRVSLAMFVSGSVPRTRMTNTSHFVNHFMERTTSLWDLP